MSMLPIEVLGDTTYRMPVVPAGERGMAWLRANVARFSEGTDHARRRALVEEVLARFPVAVPPGGDPTVVLLRFLHLPESCLDAVGLVAAAYQPHAPQSPAADDAADALVEALGGRNEAAAARVSILAQAHTATRSLVDRMRSGDARPPVSTTQRVDPNGIEVAVDLTAAPFGRGRHACPGRALATRLAAGALQ